MPINRRSILTIPILGVLFGVAGCSRTIGIYRYRVRVDVETPEGIRSGSSVMEISYGDEMSMQGGRRAVVRQKGEAIYVDLGQGKYVVALLNTGRMTPLEALYQQLGWDSESTPELARREGKLTGKVTLKGGEIPTMVTFSDQNDPTSFRVVYETKMNRDMSNRIGYLGDKGEQRYRYREIIWGNEIARDDFGAIFGPGYALKAVTLEIVSNWTPITRWVAQKFPWLEDPKYTKNPGWMQLSEEVRNIFVSLRFFER